jgi:hypothetical protein
VEAELAVYIAWFTVSNQFCRQPLRFLAVNTFGPHKLSLASAEAPQCGNRLLGQPTLEREGMLE